jgi:Domain of unknown function (DUF4126)
LRLLPNQLTALVLAVSFSAGLNVYLTVALLGLLVRAEVLTLPPSLHPVASWYVIVPCAILFVIEFVADKVPILDLVWNALQTFVRVPIAALLAYGATAQLSPGMQVIATILGGAIALAAHSGKIAARAAVSHSPEPFSNIALSIGEDGFVVFLTWFASRHPFWASLTVLTALLIVFSLLRFVFRSVCALFRGAEQAVSNAFGSQIE